MMRRSAGFHADEARRQLLKEWQNVPALELAANDYITCRVNSVDLKNRLSDVETDCRHCLHVWLLRIVGALAAPTSLALTCRVKEPSTASQAEVGRSYSITSSARYWTRRRNLCCSIISCRLSAAFSASSRLLDLKSEVTRFKQRNISATIVVDVKRFGHRIKWTRFSVHTGQN